MDIAISSSDQWARLNQFVQAELKSIEPSFDHRVFVFPDLGLAYEELTQSLTAMYPFKKSTFKEMLFMADLSEFFVELTTSLIRLILDELLLLKRRFIITL